MSAITYVHKGLKPFAISVKLDGKKVGTIKRNATAKYFYAPLGSSSISDLCESVEAVKRLIEGRAQ